MPLLSLLVLTLPIEPAALCAMTEFPNDIEPASLDIQALDATLAERNDCMPAHYLRAFAEFRREGDLATMITHLEHALELTPDNPDLLRVAGQAWLSRAGAESSLSDARKGRDFLEKAIEKDPQDVDAMAALAAFHRQAPWIAGGDMDEAYALAARIHALDEKRGVIEKARTRLADSEDDEGIGLMRDAVARYPDDAGLATEYAVLMHRYDEFEEAHRVLLGVTRFDDAELAALYQLGRTAALSGDFLDEGRSALRRYLLRGEAGEALPIEAAAAWWRLGIIEEHAGRIEAAREAFKAALAADANFEQASKALRALD